MIDLRLSGPTAQSLEVHFKDFSLVKPHLVDWAKDLLRREGYVVEVPHNWETIGQFCERLGMSRKAFGLRWKCAGRPPVDVQRGGKAARISALASNRIFDDFMRRPPLRPGRKPKQQPQPEQ